MEATWDGLPEGAPERVRVRLFAALREAAGTDVVEVESAPLVDVLEALARRFGEPFATRVRAASVLVDGARVDAGSDHVVPAGADVAVLPPFSGGAGDVAGAGAAPPPRVRRAASAPALPLEAGVLAVLLLVARALGQVVLEVVVVGLAVVVALDLVRLLARVTARPLVPAAALPAAVLPVVVAVRGEAGVRTAPALAAAALLVAFVLVLVAGRRAGVVEVLGATLLTGLLPGVGAAGAIVLGDRDAGFRWIAATALVAGASVLAVGAVRWTRPRPPWVLEVVVPLGLAALVAVASTAVLGPPWGLVPAARLVLLAVVGAITTARLVGALREDGVAVRERRSGRFLGAAGAFLLTTPVLAVLARGTG